jgi:hypothetical protein
LPTYDALMERFQVTHPTIARVLDTLVGLGVGLVAVAVPYLLDGLNQRGTSELRPIL